MAFASTNESETTPGNRTAKPPSSRDQAVIDAALEAIDSIQDELAKINGADTESALARGRVVLRARAEWALRAAIANTVLTGKKDAGTDSKQIIPTPLSDLIQAAWAELAGLEDSALVSDDAAPVEIGPGPGMVWKVGMEPSNWSGLSKEKLLLAGVSPEQLEAGTERKTGMKLVVRAVNG